MNRFNLFYIAGVLLLTTFFFPFSALPNPVSIDRSLNRLSLGRQMEYLEDKEGTLSLDDILKRGDALQWTPSEKDKLSFGFTDAVYWVRFTVINRSGREIAFYVEQGYPLIDAISFYVPREEGYTVIEAGDLKPFLERPFKHKNFIFPLSLRANTEAVYYVRQKTGSSMQFDYTLWSTDTFQEASSNEYYFLIFFYGISVVMMVYNLVIFFFIRYKDYLYYALNILFLLLFTSTQNGLAFQFLWPRFPVWTNFCLPPFIAIYTMFGNLFILNAVDCRERTPFLYKLGRVIVGSCLAAFFVTLFLSYHHAIILSASLGLITANYAFWLVLINALRKNRMALFFLIALVFFLSLVTFWVLMLFGVLPSNFFTNWAHYIGAIITETLFAIALADRINVMRVELQALNTNLEDRVEERTNELQSANKQLTEARDILWGEMELAKKIQTILLPVNPEISGYEIAAYMNPAHIVGGDYYDIIHSGGYDWVVIGDVSGHGVPAGLIMMMAQTAINVTLEKHPEMVPSELITLINKTITKNVKRLGGQKYMTMTVLALFKGGLFHYSGLHQDIVVFRARKREVELIETKGVWIGIEDNIEGLVRDDVFSVGQGDVILLFTDGITEATRNNDAETPSNRYENMFSQERLLQCFKELGHLKPDQIREGLLNALKEYTCNDDVTLVVIKRLAEGLGREL